MQPLKIFSLLILSICFFSGCSGKAYGSNNQGAPDTPKASDSPASASVDAVFSYNLLMESLISRIQTLVQINSTLNLHRLSPMNI